VHESEAAVREREGPLAGTSAGQRAVPAQGAARAAEPEGRGAHEPPARLVGRARNPAGLWIVGGGAGAPIGRLCVYVDVFSA